jgi:hypothetical protein
MTLKYRDTLPIMEVELIELDPDNPGEMQAHDLTGSTAWKLHVWLSDGTVFTRDMVVTGDPTLGVLRYTFVASDWDTTNVNGFLTVGPTLPMLPSEREHRMEYEVIGSGGTRLTFPNDGYDILRVVLDIGQA